jgi:hypothetical protein
MGGAVVQAPDQLGQAEVQDLDPPVIGDEQVVGLEIEAEDTFGMRRREALQICTACSTALRARIL